MIKYKTVLETSKITLEIMGRKKEFKNGEELTENAYTRFYPQYFVRVGEESGYSMVLAVPVFIPDPIKEFVSKEDKRKSTSEKYIYTTEEEKLDLIDEISDAIADHIEEITGVKVDSESIEDIIEDFDVKIETTEE